MENKVVAMILAGGKGTRLQALTKKNAKPAVSFAAKYRIIDFPISNCANSDINTIGILTQYESTFLDSYIGNGEKWGLNGVRCLMSSLAPRQTEEGAAWYSGTADAIAQNIDFLDQQKPDYVIILSGDHIYRTTYNEMISLCINNKADCVISVIEVDKKEASRFGIMTTDAKDNIVKFEEKPKDPQSTLASMGVYCFNWQTLREYLVKDMKNPNSSHDFGNDIIPAMLKNKKKLLAYRFKGYWRDVGTLASLHAANMDVALNRENINLFDSDLKTRIYTEDTYSMPQYVGSGALITNSVVNQGAIVLGDCDACVISNEVMIEKGAKVDHAVIMAGAIIKKGAVVHNAIIGPGAVVEEKAKINTDSNAIVLVS